MTSELTDTERRPLTADEARLVELVAEGLTDKEIASEMCVSVPWVEKHLARARGKCGAKNRAHLVALLHS